MSPTDEIEILQITKQMKRTMSSGIDGVSSNLAKDIMPFLSLPFSHICNLSMSTAIFPDSMKLSKVVPIYKNGDVNALCNYRLISLLPTLSKILERIVYNRLYSHLTMQKAIVNQQFGFRSNHSTELTLLYTHQNYFILFVMKRKLLWACMLTLVRHLIELTFEILFYKLDKYGVRGLAHQ